MATDGSTTKRRGPQARRVWLAFIPVAAFAALAALFVFALREGDPSKIPSALISKPAPDFDLPPVEGLSSPGLAVTDLRKGKVTVVNVWASWCAPCRVEHPVLLELAKRGDMVLTGINYKDEPENARRFLGLLGNPFAAVGADSDGRTAVDFGVYGVPETFVIDGKGIIRHKHVGPLTEQALKDTFLPAVAAAARQ